MTRVVLAEIGSLFSEGIEPEPLLPPAARRKRRLETLRESVPAGVRRFVLVAFNLLRRRRLAGLPAALDLLLRDRFVRSGALPDPRSVLPGAEGLAGLAPDLSTTTMMEGYDCGLRPSASLGPLAWHSPARRLVAAPAALARSDALDETLLTRGLRVSFDRDADSVLVASAGCGGCESLTPERLLSAFAELSDAGYAHAFEVHDDNGRLVAGGYGVATGRVFVLERVFSRRPEAWRAGLARLAQSLRDWDFDLVECGAGAAWLCAGAFEETSREEYLATLAEHIRGDRIGRWPSDGARAPKRSRPAAPAASSQAA